MNGGWLAWSGSGITNTNFGWQMNWMVGAATTSNMLSHLETMFLLIGLMMIAWYSSSNVTSLFRFTLFFFLRNKTILLLFLSQRGYIVGIFELCVKGRGGGLIMIYVQKWYWLLLFKDLYYIYPCYSNRLSYSM
jgi:hypothetical protein